MRSKEGWEVRQSYGLWVAASWRLKKEVVAICFGRGKENLFNLCHHDNSIICSHNARVYIDREGEAVGRCLGRRLRVVRPGDNVCCHSDRVCANQTYVRSLWKGDLVKSCIVREEGLCPSDVVCDSILTVRGLLKEVGFLA